MFQFLGLIDTKLTRPQLPSRPHTWEEAITVLKRGQNETSPDLTVVLRESSHCIEGCHFPACEWVVVRCGLSHSGPGADAQGCERPCF